MYLNFSGDDFEALGESDDSVKFPTNETDELESRETPPSRRNPVSVVSHKRTSPKGCCDLVMKSYLETILDIVGFSAIRASGFSREGNSRIYFENTVNN